MPGLGSAIVQYVNTLFDEYQQNSSYKANPFNTITKTLLLSLILSIAQTPINAFSGPNDRILFEFLTKVPDFSYESHHLFIIQKQARTKIR